jgi:hypothetical protein
MRYSQTFTEFSERVNEFIAGIPQLSNNNVLFGNGIWFGVSFLKLMVFAAQPTTHDWFLTISK